MRAFFTIKLVTLKEIMMSEFDKVLGNITRYLSFLKTILHTHTHTHTQIVLNNVSSLGQQCSC